MHIILCTTVSIAVVPGSLLKKHLGGGGGKLGNICEKSVFIAVLWCQSDCRLKSHVHMIVFAILNLCNRRCRFRDISAVGCL